MSPEALEDEPTYTEKLDIFSFGVLVIALFTKHEPSPSVLFSPRMKLVDGNLVSIPEVERRANDVEGLGQDCPLLGVVRRCLENNPSQRPCAADIVKELLEVVDRHQPDGEIDEVHNI